MAGALLPVRHSGWESTCGDRKETSKDTRMGKPLVKNIGKFAGSNGERCGGRSPFTAKSVLIAGALFIGSLGYWIAGADKDAAATWLQSIAPGTMAVTGSYLGGFFALSARCRPLWPSVCGLRFS
jgi:hypothetical protein